MDRHRANAEAALARALELLTEREREVERLSRECEQASDRILERQEIERLGAAWRTAESAANENAGLLAVAEEQRDECRRLLRIICTEYDTNAQHPGTHPVASEWCLVEESWWIQAKAAGGDDATGR